jgi:hypothetical protein
VNGRLETFHARYAQGQWFDWGEQPNLMKHLEGLGGGLPTDPPWQHGGPLLVGFGERQVLAWMRGIPFEEAGRMNAWEAWGVTGPVGSFISWPAFWEELRAEPDRSRLESMARALAAPRQSDRLPPVPANLKETLESIYLSDKLQAIAMRTPDDLPLLAWAFLLGPVAWDAATVGPPRRIPLVSREPLTYQGQIVDGRTATERARNQWSSPLLASIVDAAEEGELNAAFDQVSELRRLSPADRRRRVLAPPPKPAPELKEQPQEVQMYEQTTNRSKTPVGEATLPPTAMKERLRKLEQKVTIFGGAIIALLVLSGWMSWQLHKVRQAVEGRPARTDTSTTQAMPAETTAPPAPATTTAAETAATPSCQEWWTRPDDRARVLTRFRTALAKSNITLRNPAARVLAENAAWDPAQTPQVLTTLVRQMDLKASGCYTGNLDGAAGPGMTRAIADCGNRVPLVTTEEALQRLCRPSSQP